MSEKTTNISVENANPAIVAKGISETIQKNNTKPKKPQKPWTIKRVLGLAVAAIAVFLVANIIIDLVRGTGATYVQTQSVLPTDVQQTLSTSGIINTAEMSTIFSPVTAPISEIYVEKGRHIQEGELMFEFETKDLVRNYRQAASAAAIAGAQANQSRDGSKDNQGLVDSYKQQISKINKKIGEINDAIKALEAGVIPPTSFSSDIASSSDGTASSDGTSSVAFAGDAPTFVQASSSVTPAEDISALQQQKASLEAERATLEAKLDAASKGVLDSNGETIVNNQGTSAYVALEIAKENLAQGQAGVVAPISGIITNMTVIKGGVSSQYSVMCTIESIEQVNVIISLSRYDLGNVKEGQKGIIETAGKEYAATISQIDSMATQGATGSYVVAKISIDKPDRNIRLGLEARVKIKTGVATNVLAVPIGAITTDAEGVFCYLMVDNFATKVAVTLGMSNDTMVEVKSGIAENMIVILNPQDISDGTEVTNDPASAPSGGIFTVDMS